MNALIRTSWRNAASYGAEPGHRTQGGAKHLGVFRRSRYKQALVVGGGAPHRGTVGRTWNRRVNHRDLGGGGGCLRTTRTSYQLDDCCKSVCKSLFKANSSVESRYGWCAGGNSDLTAEANKGFHDTRNYTEPKYGNKTLQERLAFTEMNPHKGDGEGLDSHQVVSHTDPSA